MRGLKIAAIASVSLLVVMVLLVGYLFLTAEVRVTGVEVVGVSAAQDPAAFEALKNAVEEETFQGTLYQKPLEWKDPSEYVYLTYTLRIRNDCLVPRRPRHEMGSAGAEGPGRHLCLNATKKSAAK